MISWLCFQLEIVLTCSSSSHPRCTTKWSRRIATWACGPPNAINPSGQKVVKTSHILSPHGASADTVFTFFSSDATSSDGGASVSPFSAFSPFSAKLWVTSSSLLSVMLLLKMQNAKFEMIIMQDDSWWLDGNHQHGIWTLCVTQKHPWILTVWLARMHLRVQNSTELTRRFVKTNLWPRVLEFFRLIALLQLSAAGF